MMQRLEQTVRRRLGAPEGRFLVAGTAAALINWLVRFPFELVMPFAAAVLAALAVGMVAGFLLYDRWVFPGSTSPLRLKVRNFVVVNLLSQAMMFMTAIGVRELALLAGVVPLLAGAGAHLLGIVVGALFSFFGHRSLTFQRPG